WNPANNTNDFLQAVEALAADTLTSKSFSVPLFCQLMQLSEFSNDDLYRQYIGKNVLHFFRQDHGYKEGTYHKLWQGKEDNEHLAEILGNLDAQSGNFQDQVYSELEKRYPK
ncbi:MAG: dUTP diphosphatase, partial [Pseudomonadales bacterium]|nr:dUTP diphosphatase [Pseudomonadales bacterium]